MNGLTVYEARVSNHIFSVPRPIYSLLIKFIQENVYRDIKMHPPPGTPECMCSVDSSLRHRSQPRVNAISREPLVQITRNFVCGPFISS